jgi:hypothetical protein
MESGFCAEVLEYRSTPSGQELHARTTTAINLPIGTRVQLSVPEQALRIFPTRTPKLAKTL